MHSIRIDQRRKTILLFVVTWAGGAIVTALVFFFCTRNIPGPLQAMDWVKLSLAGACLCGLLGYASYQVGFCRLAIAEIGEESLVARSLFSDRTTLWEDVGAVTVHEPADKKLSWTLEIVRTDGQSLSLMIPASDGPVVRDFFQDVILSDTWEGAPQSTTMIAAYILLGLAVTAFGVWWDFKVFHDWQAGQLWQIQKQNDLKKIVTTIGLAVMAPIGGIAGVGYGIYHWVKRPIVIQPGLHHRIVSSTT